MSKSLLVIAVCLTVVASRAPNTALQGDEDAIAMADRMLETMGGKRVWSEGQAIYVELTGYFARAEEPFEESYWMDLTSPRGRFELKGGERDQTIAWTPAGGWEVDHDRFTTMDSTRHAFELAYWETQPVVLFRRLATGAPPTRVEMADDEDGFVVIDAETDRLMAQFSVNERGEPIKWRAELGEREFEHVFGPLRDFENVRQPAWGATTSGIWRYQHRSILVSDSPPPVSFDPPATE